MAIKEIQTPFGYTLHLGDIVTSPLKGVKGQTLGKIVEFRDPVKFKYSVVVKTFVALDQSAKGSKFVFCHHPHECQPYIYTFKTGDCANHVANHHIRFEIQRVEDNELVCLPMAPVLGLPRRLKASDMILHLNRSDPAHINFIVTIDEYMKVVEIRSSKQRKRKIKDEPKPKPIRIPVAAVMPKLTPPVIIHPVVVNPVANPVAANPVMVNPVMVNPVMVNPAHPKWTTTKSVGNRLVLAIKRAFQDAARDMQKTEAEFAEEFVDILKRLTTPAGFRTLMK